MSRRYPKVKPRVALTKPHDDDLHLIKMPGQFVRVLFSKRRGAFLEFALGHGGQQRLDSL